MNRLTTYNEFTFDDLYMTQQEFEDYRSKYLDLYEEIKGEGEVKEKLLFWMTSTLK